MALHARKTRPTVDEDYLGECYVMSEYYFDANVSAIVS